MLKNKTPNLQKGAFGESNSGPLAPKARIIPLDQMPCYEKFCLWMSILVSSSNYFKNVLGMLQKVLFMNVSF
jgi:hypothetical protein